MQAIGRKIAVSSLVVLLLAIIFGNSQIVQLAMAIPFMVNIVLFLRLYQKYKEVGSNGAVVAQTIQFRTALLHLIAWMMLTLVFLVMVDPVPLD